MAPEPLKRLTDAQVVALRCKGDAWPRSLLAATPIPDTWMGLVVRADGRRRFVPAGEDPRVERDDTLVLVRNRAITVPLALDDAPPADDHAVQASVELLVRWPARDDDLAALHTSLLGESELTLDRLAEAVANAGAPAALRAFIREKSTRQLVDDDQRDALLERLRAELQEFLFSAGLLLERLGTVAFTSRTLAEQDALQRDATRRMKALEARGVVERAALAVTQRRLSDLSTILAKLKAAAASDGSVQWHQLLPTLTPGERGRLLENLWRLTPDREVAQAIVVLTSQASAWLDPARPDTIAHRFDLPPELGGLRSVTYDAGHGWLLIGAATGVWAVSAADRTIARCYTVRDAGKPTTGFNSAVIAGDRLVATHSQLGCWSWPLEKPDAAEALLRPDNGVPKTVRAATVTADGHVLFGADDEVHVLAPDGQRRHTLPIGRGSVHGIAVLDRTVYVTTSDGLVVEDCWDTPNVWQVLHRRAEPIESVHARRWDDLVELVIPARADGVLGIYGDEGLVARLLTATTPIRRAWACDDTLVGLSENRDRLVVSNANLPERTGVDVPVARLLGRSIQDACIVTARAEEPRPPVRADGSGEGGTT
jgi:hypothetical protein